MRSRRHHNLAAQLEEAEKAVKRYSEGILTDFEIQLGCNAEKLTESWKSTVSALKIELESILHSNNKK